MDNTVADDLDYLQLRGTIQQTIVDAGYGPGWEKGYRDGTVDTQNAPERTKQEVLDALRALAKEQRN